MTNENEGALNDDALSELYWEGLDEIFQRTDGIASIKDLLTYFMDKAVGNGIGSVENNVGDVIAFNMWAQNQEIRLNFDQWNLLQINLLVLLEDKGITGFSEGLAIAYIESTNQSIAEELLPDFVSPKQIIEATHIVLQNDVNLYDSPLIYYYGLLVSGINNNAQVSIKDWREIELLLSIFHPDQSDIDESDTDEFELKLELLQEVISIAMIINTKGKVNHP